MGAGHGSVAQSETSRNTEGSPKSRSHTTGSRDSVRRLGFTGGTSRWGTLWRVGAALATQRSGWTCDVQPLVRLRELTGETPCPGPSHLASLLPPSDCPRLDSLSVLVT